jgi:hypothetical protein
VQYLSPWQDRKSASLTRSLIGDGEQRERHGEQLFTPNFLLAP